MQCLQINTIHVFTNIMIRHYGISHSCYNEISLDSNPLHLVAERGTNAKFLEGFFKQLFDRKT